MHIAKIRLRRKKINAILAQKTKMHYNISD